MTARIGGIRSVRLATAAAAAVAIAGCGATRTVTVEQSSQTSGNTTAKTLQQLLAAHGLSGAQVTCTRRLIVDAGAIDDCVLTHAGQSATVRFTWRNTHGAINPDSVKVEP